MSNTNYELYLYRCGLICDARSLCWLWSHSETEDKCHIFTNVNTPLTITEDTSYYRSYTESSNFVFGYLTSGLVNSWQDGNNYCIKSFGSVLAYEPNSTIMRMIHEKLGVDTILVGLHKTTAGWVDGFDNVIDPKSISWQSDQPDGESKGEDSTLSYNGEIADITKTQEFPDHVAYICEMTTLI